MKLSISEKWDMIEWFITRGASKFHDITFRRADTPEPYYRSCVVENNYKGTTKKEREQLRINFQFFWSHENYFDNPTKSRRKKMINSNGDSVFVWFF